MGASPSFYSYIIRLDLPANCNHLETLHRCWLCSCCLWTTPFALPIWEWSGEAFSLLDWTPCSLPSLDCKVICLRPIAVFSLHLGLVCFTCKVKWPSTSFVMKVWKCGFAKLALAKWMQTSEPSCFANKNRLPPQGSMMMCNVVHCSVVAHG